MGSGTFTASAYCSYSMSSGKMLDTRGYVTSGQRFEANSINKKLNPRNVIRECVNSDEHPNTLPIILALDVTGSMGSACYRTAQALGVIITDLLKKHKKDDLEFLIMGIGDIECDSAPIQASQFESDVRIAKDLDNLYLEGGGGGNLCESYSAAWYFGLNRTKLDCYDKQNKKGIIITMGDEPLNDSLNVRNLTKFIGKGDDKFETNEIDSNMLYKQACKKFNIFHIAIDDRSSSYSHYNHDIQNTFGKLLKDHLKVSTINDLPIVIEECISSSIDGSADDNQQSQNIINENGEISW